MIYIKISTYFNTKFTFFIDMYFFVIYNKNGGIFMKSTSAFKELKKHGVYDYPFEKYDISSKHVWQFATSHWHDETEIIYVKKGSVKITINGKTFTGNEGSLFIVNSGEMHEIDGLIVPISYTAFVFDFNMLSFKSEDFAQQNFIEPVLNGAMRFENCVTSSPKILELLKQIEKSNPSPLQVRTLVTKALLLQFFALLIEEKQFTIYKKTNVSFQKNDTLKEIIQFINNNFSHELTLRQIAKQFNMSHKYFCKFFKNNFQKTFIEYLNDVRLKNALQLLENKNLSVTETALSCGFSNMSYFTRTFKKKIGCTPSEYIKSRR